MSEADIFEETPKLTPAKLDEFDGLLTREELALVDERLAQHEAGPESAISWDTLKARLEGKFGQPVSL